MLKMVLQYEFGQIVFEWLMVKKSCPLENLPFYVKIVHNELLAIAYLPNEKSYQIV